MLDAGGDPEAVTGPEVELHLDVAVAVATGEADAGLGLRSAALTLGLDFVPLVREPFEIATTRAQTGGLRAAPATRSASPSVRRQVDALGGYDLAAPARSSRSAERSGRDEPAPAPRSKRSGSGRSPTGPSAAPASEIRTGAPASCRATVSSASRGSAPPARSARAHGRRPSATAARAAGVIRAHASAQRPPRSAST